MLIGRGSDFDIVPTDFSKIERVNMNKQGRDKLRDAVQDPMNFGALRNYKAEILELLNCVVLTEEQGESASHALGDCIVRTVEYIQPDGEYRKTQIEIDLQLASISARRTEDLINSTPPMDAETARKLEELQKEKI